MIKRRLTGVIKIGNVSIGGNCPIAIQSMTNIPTGNINGNVDQIRGLVESGCDIVRLEVSSLRDIDNFRKIKYQLRNDGINIPMVADTHFSPKIAIECLEVADKVRINAGNFSDSMVKKSSLSHKEFLEGKEKLQSRLMVFFERAKELDVPVRIGINHGSLSPRITYKFGNTVEAMWESANECLVVASDIGFSSVVLSFKSSNVLEMIESNRLACKKMDENGWNCPVHLGVTEAGNGEYSRVKSSIGIGTLLIDGIGDTIRVSLTENPIKEIAVAKDILQACGVQQYRPEVIACPSCGRTSYEIQSVLNMIKLLVSDIQEASCMKIAVMGCAINGIGEARGADIAIVGNPDGTLSIYQKDLSIVSHIKEDDIENVFLSVLRAK